MTQSYRVPKFRDCQLQFYPAREEIEVFLISGHPRGGAGRTFASLAGSGTNKEFFRADLSMVYFDNFRNWFIMFMRQMLGGVWQIFSNIFLGIGQIFNFPAYYRQLTGQDFGWAWILVFLVLLFALLIWGGLIFLIILGIRKYIRFRRTIVGKEDLLEEIADLHRDVIRLTADRFFVLLDSASDFALSNNKLALMNAIEAYNRSSSKPYKLSVSMTGNMFNLRDCDINSLMDSFDKMMKASKYGYESPVFKELEQDEEE